MSTTIPPAVRLDKFSEVFPVELSGGAATNNFEHDSHPFQAYIIDEKWKLHQFLVSWVRAFLLRVSRENVKMRLS
jgi:hypothetical protein